MRLIADIEGNNLLTDIEHIWCICFRDLDSVQTWDFTPDNLGNLTRFLVDSFGKSSITPRELVFHNGIGFDLPAMKKVLDIDYHIGPDLLLDTPIEHTDTLLLSKLFNPDREGGHSLESWGKRLGCFKGNYNDWSRFTPEMLLYCRQDVEVLRRTYLELEKERYNG